MKEYRITTTINVFINAESEEAAELIAQEMDISFTHDDKALYDELIDWEVSEVD